MLPIQSVISKPLTNHELYEINQQQQTDQSKSNRKSSSIFERQGSMNVIGATTSGYFNTQSGKSYAQ